LDHRPIRQRFLAPEVVPQVCQQVYHTAQQQRDSPPIGTPDEIVAKLQTLQAAGVEYVMLNAAGPAANLRRFAREVMPHMAAQPCRDAATS
jgi:alkanesulfonate monooxygenase SsuD/methylene tetrahydromethanopterin reductase-like flavin-dependent oxidoreductase (luciferase family)